MSETLLSTKDVAKILKVTPIRVRALIRDGRLNALKVGRDYVIKQSDLEAVKDRKPGRPPKQTSGK